MFSCFSTKRPPGEGRSSKDRNLVPNRDIVEARELQALFGQFCALCKLLVLDGLHRCQCFMDLAHHHGSGKGNHCRRHTDGADRKRLPQNGILGRREYIEVIHHNDTGRHPETSAEGTPHQPFQVVERDLDGCALGKSTGADPLAGAGENARATNHEGDVAGGHDGQEELRDAISNHFRLLKQVLQVAPYGAESQCS